MAKKKKEEKLYWVFVIYDGDDQSMIANGVSKEDAESEIKQWLKDHNCDEWSNENFMIFDTPPLSSDRLDLIQDNEPRYDAEIKE